MRRDKSFKGRGGRPGRGGRGDRNGGFRDRLPKDKEKATEILDRQLMQFQAKHGGDTSIFKEA